MSPKDCAYIVERLAIRFMALVTDHERQLTEHRAAFGARTEADAKIIAGLRSEIVAARMAVLERDSLMSERDGLLIQVQDMRAEINRLTGHNADAALHDLLRREYDKALTLCETDEQTPAECIGSLNARIDRLQDDARSDARVREDLHRINVELRAEVAFLKIRDREYEKALDLCDKEEQTPAECIAALQEWMRASIVRGDFEQMEVAALKSQSPHPVKVGEWVRRTSFEHSIGTRIGAIAQVIDMDDDGDYEVAINGTKHCWSPKYCTPCDTPEATHAEPDLTQLHAKGKEAWSDVPNATQWVEEMRGNSEATHDTEAGKAVAERTVRTEPVAEEIKVGDMAKVVGASGDLTAQSDIGKIGEVLKIDSMDGTVLLSGGAGWVDHRDVRKVTP